VVAGNRFLYGLSGSIDNQKFNVSPCKTEVANKKSHTCCCVELLCV
jgi:hypothetical protein